MLFRTISSVKEMRLTLLQILAFLLVLSLYAGEQIQTEQLLIMEIGLTKFASFRGKNVRELSYRIRAWTPKAAQPGSTQLVR